MRTLSPSRRNFLSCMSYLASGMVMKSNADEFPEVTYPRATDGDDRYEPNWENKLSITVGQNQGDLQGKTDRVIQAAVDYLNRMNGGTLKILPGTYTLRNSVFLPSGIKIMGSGEETILRKEASKRIELAQDSDWYDQEITVKNADGFEVGDGIALQAKNPSHGGNTVIKRTIVATSGNRLKLNDGLRDNLWLSGNPTCTSLFPLLTSERTQDVVIENLTLDGNKENNLNFNGNYGGCIFLQDCNRYHIRDVTTRNYNGDGISFQISHDVRVENCHSHDNTDLGVHPGSGSQRPLIRGNLLERNNQGIFWCWGVKYGLAENNRIRSNRSYGISIGHCDTDNVMRKNEITDSGKIGILFRDDVRGMDFWANRNLVENNRIVNSGSENGVAIDITGKTKDIQLLNNEIVEERAPLNRIGIRIGEAAGKVTLARNQISGFAHQIEDQRIS